MDESDFYLAFSYAPGIGPKRFSDLLTYFESAKSIWIADDVVLSRAGIGPKTLEVLGEFRRTFKIETEKKKLEELGITFVPRNSKKYPSQLLHLPNPPIGIFCKGNLLLLKEYTHTFAVVGTRKTTQYGRDVTKKIVTELASSRLCIVSGLALGIDAISHLSALEAQGSTIAVLGCGVDCCYPQENYNLYKSILENDGLIISEYPPAVPPSKGSFPARNRIIAALSEGILVTEATEDSGSLITADIARELGKKIFAIPGPITSPGSMGTLALIQKGAKLVRNSDDIVNLLTGVILTDSSVSNPHLDGMEKKIYELLREEKEVDELARALSISVHRLNATISEMELTGLVVVENGKVRKSNL